MEQEIKEMSLVSILDFYSQFHCFQKNSHILALEDI